MSELPDIGIKLLIPESNPADLNALRYLMLRRATDQDDREWDVPGGRADLVTDVVPLDTERRELREEVGSDDVGEPVPIAMQHIVRPGLRDVIRFTTLAKAQNPDTFKPILSPEHREYAWLTRREIGRRVSDRYLPQVVAENGSLHKIERLGVAHLGAGAVEAAVVQLRLLG